MQGDPKSADGCDISYCRDSVGHRTPLEAMAAPVEKILWLPCVVPSADRPDYLATVSVDKTSQDFCKARPRVYVKAELDKLAVIPEKTPRLEGEKNLEVNVSSFTNRFLQL